MDKEIARRKTLCELADNPEWDETVVLARNLSAEQKAFLKEHPPGLVKALWNHFEATRDQCGCESVSHERPDCSVRLIERLLIDEESR
ncbi:MAG TPA: hypothetical protein VJA26_11575 [Gammaproteobacteria bacterium]|nr:hypothetical protein [Gammaproteobacteria bacterium]